MKKNTKFNLALILLIFVIITILIILVYFYYLNLICYKLHESQNKNWMSDLTDIIILGINNRELYSKINRDGKNISFWYVYWFFHTKTETIWILANMRNKFSSSIQLNMYRYNIEKNNIISESINFDMNDINIVKKENNLILNFKNMYEQKINLIEGKSTLQINTNKFKIFFNLSITDCNTNQASFVPPVHNFLSNFVNVKGIQTGTPGEWFSDNPYIGKIINGEINGEQIYKGTYWFDNFIACNNGFLTTYIWFVILNDDWLIYLLWFGDEEEHNKKGFLKPILIKNNKENRMIYSGIIDSVPAITNYIQMNYESSKQLGDEHYDDYKINFNSNEIQIQIKSKQNTCKKVFDFYYYKNEEINMNFDNKWDENYYNVLSNIIYVEYLVYVDVSITYKGLTENFTDRQIVDAMYRSNKNIPRTINY